MHFSFCHRKPERSFFYKGKQFPICARCTGIYTGYLTLPVFIFGFYSIPIIPTLLMVFPTFLDGWIQAKTEYESTNPRRFISGLLSGVGLMSLAAWVGDFLGQIVLRLL